MHNYLTDLRSYILCGGANERGFDRQSKKQFVKYESESDWTGNDP